MRNFHKKRHLISCLDADELKPAAEIEYEVQVTASGRKFYTIRMKAIQASNLPIDRVWNIVKRVDSTRWFGRILFLTLPSEAAKVFRPYVAFTAYGAGVKNMLCAFETKSKYNNAFPIFNEEFTFQTTGDWKKIDIQISVKVSFRAPISF